MRRIRSAFVSFVRVWQHDIWHAGGPPTQPSRKYSYAVLRVISTSLSGLLTNRVTSRAAALSFSTLLSIGPLVALTVLVAGFALGKQDPHIVTEKIEAFVKFIAPPVKRFELVEQQHASQRESRDVALNPGVVDFFNNSISGAQSSTAGALSLITLIMIVLLLFSSIEDTFNDIWGVRRGRTWATRVMLYWTILTLGAVVFFIAVGGLSAATFINFFNERLAALPFGPGLVQLAKFLLPAISAFLIIGGLTLFYRYIPNTHVQWRAALAGALLVTTLLVMNNLLAFSYFRRVDLTRSLYGSLSFIPIFMLGLYVFWLFVLVGGQVSYAVQNARFRNSQVVWSQLTESARERLTLAVLLTIGRRFQECLPACSVQDLAKAVRVPTQLVNESLNTLVDMKLVTPVPPDSQSSATEMLYQPGRPLNRITLGEFKALFDNHGNDPAGAAIDHLDPLGDEYRKETQGLLSEEFFTTSLQDLFERFQFDVTIPPFRSIDQKSS